MNKLLATAFAATLAAAGSGATAQDAEAYVIEDTSAWSYEFSLYLWGSEVGGVANGADFDISFDQLAEDLDFALVGALRAHNGPWMTYGELNYANVGKAGSAKYTISPGDLDFDIDVDSVSDATIKTTMVNFGGGYQMVDTGTYSLYGTFGVRYFKIDGDLTLDLEGPVRNRSFKVNESRDYWDATIGVTGRAAFNENWFLTYIADVGAGDSDLTWQAGAGIGYNFGRQDVVLGYRHVEWDFPSDRTLTNYYMSGPILSWNIRF